MKDEIKEKIDDIFWEVKKHPMDSDYLVKKEEMKLLLDYITNLQEENEILKKDVESLKNNYNDLVKMYENRLNSYLDLKSRNEKAIEYMNNYIEVEDAPINERIKTEFKEVIRLLTGGDE